MSENNISNGGPMEGSHEIHDSERVPPRVGRRSMILGVAAGGAGVAAGLVAGADPAAAAAGKPVKLGKTNTAHTTTTVTNTAGTAVVGTTSAAPSNNDTAIGVQGISSQGYGVRGDSSGFYAGVGGYASEEGAAGVYGEGDGANGFGVYGTTTGSGGTALYAAGNATVTGTLAKGGGSFRIDHPLDPADKFLYHSFVESPDMMNVYNGTVVLDRRGRATVQLPDWFEALNRDFRYQLTAVGKAAPRLHVAKEVDEGHFTIAGGKAGQKVSWQVTGIRQDAWANTYRIPVEVEKAAEDKGRYLHPELFGGEPISEIAWIQEPMPQETREIA
jgi:hypothetical protein